MNFETMVNRIVPIPRQVKELEGAPLKRASAFQITAPTAPYGPVKTAGERIGALLNSKEGEAVTVTLSIGEAPVAMRCPEEGYSLKVSHDRVDITGFGEKGLLYGVITLEQLFAGEEEILPLEVLDWPDNPMRGIKQECRYGSNLMEKEEWMALLDDLAYRKMNTMGLAFYGCWTVQYDGLVSEYLYMPLKNHPEIQTPMQIKYYSPEKGAWIEEQKLPPIFCNNLLEEVFRKARDLGIQIVPGWNSFGHNTLIPAHIPEVSPVDENGVPQLYGFCTSNPATYELLFEIYDQIVDDYMRPYGMETVNLCLDEVHAGAGRHKDDIWMVRDPWCQCPVCREQEKGDLYIAHIIKLVSYLKQKGVKGVMICGDMLQEGRRSKLGWLGDRLMDAARAAGVEDTLLIDWWSYHNIESKNWIKTMHPELGLRGIVAPWNGYHTWSITLQPLDNARILGAINQKDQGEGMVAYAMWDRGCDRTHDAIAEFSWNYEKAGTSEDVTRRYARRHFGSREREAYRAYRLMDYAIEQRHTTKWSIPEKDSISNLDLLTYQLSPYNFSYVKAGKPYPRAFLDEALTFVLSMRSDVERALYTVSTMAREAESIFESLAQDPACDREMAKRQAYECGNYRVLAEDWLAILQMQDLCEVGDYEAVAKIAESRKMARIALMALCEEVKERSIAVAMAMRQQSIFMQMFADIATYAANPTVASWNLMDIYEILSERSLWLR